MASNKKTQSKDPEATVTKKEKNNQKDPNNIQRY
jgi:hypothetical protein